MLNVRVHRAKILYNLLNFKVLKFNKFYSIVVCITFSTKSFCRRSQLSMKVIFIENKAHSLKHFLTTRTEINKCSDWSKHAYSVSSWTSEWFVLMQILTCSCFLELACKIRELFAHHNKLNRSRQLQTCCLDF